MPERTLIIGGAGFIGSHFCDRLLADGNQVTVFDNFSSGTEWHVEHHGDNTRFDLVKGDITDEGLLVEVMRDHDLVVHLASNPDIARAATDPSIDFTAGTLLIHTVIEAMRKSGVSSLVYASGSGVYGDVGEVEVDENWGPLVPVSTYAASKIAGEALISAYCAMFGFHAVAFRFANVVGPRQTHGVGFDFLRRLRSDRSHLDVLGNGRQSKSYIHVDDVVEAVLLAWRHARGPYDVFNVATGDYTTVRQIAELTLDVLGLDPAVTEVRYTKENRGWKGDVPVVRLATSRIRAVGWRPRRGSNDAVRASLEAMTADARHWSAESARP